jgi:hypothetical protein
MSLQKTLFYDTLGFMPKNKDKKNTVIQHKF